MHIPPSERKPARKPSTDLFMEAARHEHGDFAPLDPSALQLAKDIENSNRPDLKSPDREPISARLGSFPRAKLPYAQTAKN